MQVRSLGWEDPLEEGVATHSSILAWRTPWTEEPGGLQSMGSQRARHERVVNMHIHTQIQLDTAQLLKMGGQSLRNVRISFSRFPEHYSFPVVRGPQLQLKLVGQRLHSALRPNQ